MIAEGHRAVMMYLVQRDDADSFTIATDIDPDYADALRKAKKAGVEIVCYDCTLSPEAITINRPLPVEFE